VPFIHLALAPWMLYAIISRRNLLVLSTAAFWLAHTLYAAAFYTTVIMLVSIALGLVTLRILRDEADVLSWKPIAQNFLIVLSAATVISLPKVIGSLDFLALFPREQQMQEVSPGGALAYALGNVFYPFPYDISRVTGWQYGPWEAYQYLLPLLFPALVFVIIGKRTTISWKSVLLVFICLMAISVTLTSGALSSAFAALPILKSFHVNPRWNGVILLPTLLLAIIVMRQTGFLGSTKRSNRLGVLFFVAVFSVVPLLYVAPSASWGFYPDGAGINRGAKRVGFCYEPIFGYRLETFPGLSPDINWIDAPLRNPVCLLKSGQCKPGSGISVDDTRQSLLAFSLEQPNRAVTWSRPFSLALYAFAFLCMLGVFVKSAFETIKQCRDEVCR
jgi:hypothetical protein